MSRLIHGARLSLTVGLAATVLTVVVAVLIGGTTGFIGGRLDLVTQRFVDAWMAFPGLLLLTIMSIAGRGMLCPWMRHTFCASASRRSNGAHRTR